MQGELIYGNTSLLGRNDGNASGNALSSGKGPQESNEIDRDELPVLDINNSNRRLDKYLFYFSSRL